MEILPEQEWPTSGLKMTDVGDAILVSQGGKTYRARKWRLTPDVVAVVDTALRHGLVANWVKGHPQEAYYSGGTKFYKGSHHITFARDPREGWILVLGGEAGPPNLRCVTINHRYGGAVHRSGVPYRWQHMGSHNVEIDPADLETALSAITNDVIDAVENREDAKVSARRVLQRTGLRDESDLEIALLDHFARLPKADIPSCIVRPRYFDGNGDIKIPDVLVECRNGARIVVELKFPHGIWAHVDQLLGYLRISGITAIHGVLIARSFDDDLIKQLAREHPENTISFYQYGFDNQLELRHCAGPRILEEHKLTIVTETIPPEASLQDSHRTSSSSRDFLRMAHKAIKMVRSAHSASESTPSTPEFAAAGSQRWLQVAVSRTPQLLDRAFRESGALDSDESLAWCSPLATTNFVEYRDERALEMLGIAELPVMKLEDFWPRRGPVWDGLAVTSKGQFIFVEAKAHIPEVLSPPSQAGEASRKKILSALEETRRFYAPRSEKIWFEHFYQYCNRLAHHYFLSHVNGLPSRLIFLDFVNAHEMNGPTSPQEWKGAKRLIHAFLGLPESLTEHSVHHAYVDVHELNPDR